MNILYICERPYVLYKALLKTILNGKKDNIDIIISNHMAGMEKIYPYIEKANIFNEVSFFDDVGYQEYVKNEKLSDYIKFPKIIISWPRKLKKYFEYQKTSLNSEILDKVNFDKYDEIVANDGVSAINFVLFNKKIVHTVSEHAKNNFQIKVRLHIIAVWCTVLLDRMNIIPAYSGMSKYVDKVEVTDKKNLVRYIKKKEIIECSITDLEKKLSYQQRQQLYSIYAEAYDLPSEFDRKVDLLLTTALYKDGLVATEEDQRACYKKMIEDYCNPYNNIVLIKPHPKDEMYYADICENAIVVPSSISAEILSMCNSLKIETVVTLCSTAIMSFKEAENMIVTGPEYLSSFNSTMQRNQFESLNNTSEMIKKLLKNGGDKW